MKNQLLLQKYEYIIPASCGLLARTGNISHQHVEGRLLFAKLVVDFVNGTLRFEADRQFTIPINQKGKPVRRFPKKERIIFKGAVYPSIGIDLNDQNNDGLIFPVE